MTFLELCQKVAQESGTISDLTAPATVASQTGRLLRIVNWVIRAHNDIQIMRHDWRWLTKEFSGDCIVSTRRYALADLVPSETRFANWIWTNEEDDRSISAYLKATGQSVEGYLTPLPWDVFRTTCLFGSEATKTGQPSYYSIDNDLKLCLHPIPDAVYTIRGEFYRGPQTLAADGDTPEMPSQHHMAIVWKALMLMGVFDEATQQNPEWDFLLQSHIDLLIEKQTPRLERSGPLA